MLKKKLIKSKIARDNNVIKQTIHISESSKLIQKDFKPKNEWVGMVIR